MGQFKFNRSIPGTDKNWEVTVHYQKFVSPPPPCFYPGEDSPFKLITFLPEITVGNPHSLAGENELIKNLKGGAYISSPVYCYNKNGVVVSMRPLKSHAGVVSVGYVIAQEAGVRQLYDWQQMTANRRQLVIDRIEELVHYYQVYLDGDVYTGVLETPSRKSRIDLGVAYDDNPEAYYAEMAYLYMQRGDDLLIREKCQPEHQPWNARCRPWEIKNK